MAGTNRDINNTQTITRDETHGGVDVRLNVDNDMVANPGEYVQAVKDMPKNLKGAGRHVGNITKAHYLDTKRQVQGNEIVRGTYMNNSEVDSYVDTNGEYAVGAHTREDAAMRERREARLEYGDGIVLQNPRVRSNLERMNQNLIDMGYDNESFVIRVTGGDRYRDPDDPSVIRSSSNNLPIPGSSQRSQHLEENAGAAADVEYEGIPENAFENARRATDFANGFYKDDYSDGHKHLALPRNNRK